MSKLLDISGQRFGRLVVRSYAKNSKWECVCDCGALTTVQSVRLRQGDTSSCGCYQRDRASEANTTHGARRTRAYNTWTNMRKRCANLEGPDAPWYAAKGIAVCNRWQNFNLFLDDMGQPPEGASLDRIDGALGYSPENCRWATAREQSHNSKVTKLSDHDVRAIRGDARPYKDIAAQYGISKGHVCKVRSGKFYSRLLEV